jgi:bifunctional non-homologous end joining protein LigD
MVRRDGASVRLYTRSTYDCTARLPAIAAAAERIKAKSFIIDGEAVVLGPDGLSRFDELRRREAAQNAILYAFDLIERDGDDLRNRLFLDRKDALAGLLPRHQGRHPTKRPCCRGWSDPFSSMLAGLALRVSSPARGRHLSIRSMPVLDQVRNPASIAVQRERSEKWNR